MYLINVIVEVWNDLVSQNWCLGVKNWVFLVYFFHWETSRVCLLQHHYLLWSVKKIMTCVNGAGATLHSILREAKSISIRNKKNMMGDKWSLCRRQVVLTWGKLCWIGGWLYLNCCFCGDMFWGRVVLTFITHQPPKTALY